MSTALEVLNVSQFFRSGFWMKQVAVLNDVSFTVPNQSIFGFLGANGAGKTTLIHLIAGLRSPSSGEVKVFGMNSSSIGARSRIGFLPERPYFHEHLTGEDLLKYYGALSGLSRPKVLSRISTVLDAVGMKDARRTELRRYSKGMLQRIGIAQALIHDPEFLILDEPMSGLDPIGRRDVRELFLKLKAEGRTLFFTSHVIADIEAVCDQIGLIQRGKLMEYGPISRFTSDGIESYFTSSQSGKKGKVARTDLSR